MKFVKLTNRLKDSNFKTDYPFNPLTLIFFGLFIAVLLISCSSSSTQPTLPNTSISLPTTTPVPPSSTPIPTATIFAPDSPFQAWLDPALPIHLQNAISQTDFLDITADETSAEIIFSLEPGTEAGFWFYLATVPFYSYQEEVQSIDLHNCWKTGPDESLPFKIILVSDATMETFELLWGPGHKDCVKPFSAEDLSHELWLLQDAIGLLPFNQIQPSLKILAVDGEDPLSKDFNQTEYPLLVGFNYQIPPDTFIDPGELHYISNFNPGKLSSVALTGVTALVRDTANIMEAQGVTYPAGDIQDILLQADITHVNNEVPFAEDCPPPDTYQASLRFCSNDKYIDLLDAIGTDIVELSGDHFGDWGPDAMYHTIDLYHLKGWATYGGGINLADGLAPTFLDHNGNHFAFIGCNGKGIDRYATATDEEPGAAQCDFNWMTAEITRLTGEGYIVIATMQHEEVDSFGSIALQQYDFRRLAEAGAVIVSGSQSHHPQAIEYTGNSLIHYGLGNLFFDQWFLAHYNPKSHINKDKSFIDLHYFYDGNHIGTRLIPMQFIDNARPRPMTLEERIPFLDEVYRYSKWDGEWIYLYPTGYMYHRMDK